MCEQDVLIGYLYDDLADDDRVAFESHLRDCAACHDELKTLRSVRVDLRAWTAPDIDLDFRVVRGPSRTGHVLRTPLPAWRTWYTPAAGLAAAAVLVLAAASAIAHVEVHSGRDGLTVRTGWSAVPGPTSERVSAARPAASVAAASDQAAGSPGVHLAATADDVGFLKGLEQRLVALESSSRDHNVRNASTLSARAADAEIIRRVRELVSESEGRQKGELAFRIAQVLRDVDAQRVADLSRIQQGLGRIDATVTAEAASHRDLTNYILTSAKQK